MQIIKKYEANLDNKKRLTVCGVSFKHYVLEVYSNGKIVLNPRILSDPDSISQIPLK
jgi:hypothetical protein